MRPADYAIGPAPFCFRACHKATKSIGCSSTGGKPPSRVTSDRMLRANGKSKPRALDQQNRLNRVLRDAIQSKNARVRQLTDEDRPALARPPTWPSTFGPSVASALTTSTTSNTFWPS